MKYKIVNSDDQVIEPGATITSRNDPRTTATFLYVSQGSNAGSTGKIYVSYGEGNNRELFPTVFGLKIVEDK